MTASTTHSGLRGHAGHGLEHRRPGACRDGRLAVAESRTHSLLTKGAILDSVATVRAVAGVITCSIVIAEWAGTADRTDLSSGRDAPEARGLISIREESWPQAAGSSELRAVISIEATNGESIRWYARRVLRLDQASASWHDMERQIARVGRASAPPRDESEET